jgi:hypothetical protein
MTYIHTHTHTLGRTPLHEGSARRRDLYLTTQNTQKRQTSMTPAGFELAIPANKWPQTHALDRDATVIGHFVLTVHQQGEASSRCSITRIPPLPCHAQTSKSLGLLHVSLQLTFKNSIFSVHALYLLVLCGSQNKQRSFPYTDCFYNRDGVCSLHTRNESHIQLTDTKDVVLLCWSSCCYELDVCEGG